MAQRFKVGDVVRLKSGGPNMTVNGYRESLDDLFDDKPLSKEITYTKDVDCRWFAYEGEARRHTQSRGLFHEDMLELVDE